MPIPSPERYDLVPLQAPATPPPTPTCTPWLLTSLVLMGLNTYFPWLSPASSLWSPFKQLSQFSTGQHPGVALPLTYDLFEDLEDIELASGMANAPSIFATF
ncbi:hypothetical protein DSO57_1024478 [Entomophthora muscae]|uniref:Uncharacterized protein n=1 Tax=Entomophthora muscae TaxID=34485 RepID=A0ACC2TPZ2_9FUNG|nr:hypothetical protein DSO57_1024478 [Entomophthora muscae]